MIASGIPSAASMCYDSTQHQLVIPMNPNNALAFYCSGRLIVRRKVNEQKGGIYSPFCATFLVKSARIQLSLKAFPLSG